jgi:hypothetical protein
MFQIGLLYRVRLNFIASKNIREGYEYFVTLGFHGDLGAAGSTARKVDNVLTGEHLDG